jgi:TetR/AcrR family transcriptional repressor of mexJK operon
MAAERTSRARGRRKDPAKREAILAAAVHLFGAERYDRVSMAALARQAGVSKLTLYSHFANKEAIFQQAVAATCEAHAPRHLFAAASEQPLRDRLIAIAEGFVILVFSKEALDLCRLLASQPPGRSALGQLFWEAGPQRAIRDLAGLLNAASERGELAVDDPERAASVFFSLLKRDLHERCLIRVLAREALLPQLQGHAAREVDLFLRAYAPANRRPEG